MVLSYKIDFEDGMFKYNCIPYSSYLRTRAKDMEKIYGILNNIDVLREQHEKDGTSNCICNEFEMIFNFNGCVKIKNISNWFSIKQEVPIIKKELSKYIKDYNKESVKDIMVKIKSLKKGSSNRIKEDLK